MEQSSNPLTERTGIHKKRGIECFNENPSCCNARMFQGYYTVLLKWMKYIPEISEENNKRLAVIWETNDGEEQQSKQYS